MEGSLYAEPLVQLVATESIERGMELFADYGGGFDLKTIEKATAAGAMSHTTTSHLSTSDGISVIGATMSTLTQSTENPSGRVEALDYENYGRSTPMQQDSCSYPNPLSTAYSW